MHGFTMSSINVHDGHSIAEFGLIFRGLYYFSVSSTGDVRGESDIRE